MLKIFITHKDCFVRFGFDWFCNFLISRGVEIVIVNNESLSPKEELVQDLISIISSLPFMSANDFDKWVNNTHSKEKGYEWIKDVSSKARKKSIVNAETAYKRFFKRLAKFPRFKKKRNQDVNIYFPKNNNTDWTVERKSV